MLALQTTILTLLLFVFSLTPVHSQTPLPPLLPSPPPLPHLQPLFELPRLNPPPPRFPTFSPPSNSFLSDIELEESVTLPTEVSLPDLPTSFEEGGMDNSGRGFDRQFSNRETSSGRASSSGQSSNRETSSEGASSSPFGGQVLWTNEECVSPPGTLVLLSAPTSGYYFFSPSSRPYANFSPPTSGKWVLGMAGASTQCWIQVGTTLVLIGEGPLVSFYGIN